MTTVAGATTPGGAREAAAESAVSEALVEERLRAVSRDVRRAMLAAVPDAEPHDWLYRLVRSYPSRPGKAIRPALCIATCRAFGGRDDDALPPAVAIEMFHNAFLVHDDIADGSERRRGRPTLPAEWGTGLALNAGDALATLANQLLRRHARRLDDALADRLLDEFDAMALRTLEGQATELGWQRDAVADLLPEDYLDLIMRKTCWYTTIHPLRVGALVGSGGRADLRPMVRFGFHLGAAFQIQDDLLNLVGDESVYGKEINGDLREGKQTLVLIHLNRQRARCQANAGPDPPHRPRHRPRPRGGRPLPPLGAGRPNRRRGRRDPGADRRVREHRVHPGVRRRHRRLGPGRVRGRVRQRPT